MMGRVRHAFLDHGYDQLTMIGLAKACDITPRGLYHHFNSKQEAFREVIRWRHGVEIEAGFEAGERVLAAGGGVLDTIVAVLDGRYGETRRDLSRSPHASEINSEAFRRCADIMAQSAIVFQDRLAALLNDLAAQGLVRFRPDCTANAVAQLLADGARGVNQSLPPKPTDGLPERYRAMCAAILYGCAEAPNESA
jgi:AcrR family transcriptional regulator